MRPEIAQPTAVTPPKRHHTVPRFIIEQFAGGSKTVRTWFKDQAVVRDVLPKDLFVVGQFHSLYMRDGSRDPTLEIQLARLEALVSPVVEEIVTALRERREIDLKIEGKTLLDLFIYLQFKRVPERFTKLRGEIEFEEVLRKTIEGWKKEFPERAHELDHLSDAEIEKRVFHNSRIKAIRDFRGPVLGVMVDRHLDIVQINPKLGRQFVLGSNPVVAFKGMVEPERMQLLMPIAPDIAIGHGPKGAGFREIMVHDPARIRAFNLAMRDQSDALASASDRLLESIRNPR